MLAQLDHETGVHHTVVNRPWKQLLGGSGYSREDYVRQLVTTYGFEAPYETACAYTPGVSQVIDLRGRWRSGLIAQDLLTLGWAADQITQVKCYSRAPFQDAVEALGWMYVVERSALMHLDVRDELETRFFDIGRACTYLGAYESTINKRWAELGIALDRFIGSNRVADRVIAAAQEAFAALNQWRRACDPGLRSDPGLRCVGATERG